MPVTDTFSAWPLSDTEKSLLSKSIRLRIWPFSRLLPETPETVNAGRFAASRLSVADCVYADDVKSSCPGVLSVKVNADPAVCNRFNSLPDVLKVVPVALASERDAETELIKPST